MFESLSAQRLRCVVRYSVPYLSHLCRFVSVELIAPGETLRRGQLMRLKHAETDPEILVFTDWNQVGFDQTKAVFRGDGVQGFIDRLAHSGSIVFGNVGFNQEHV